MNLAALAAHIVARDTPLLLVDTCAIGDIIREAHRSTHKGKSIEAARILTDASVASALTIVAAQTVLDEWQRHRPNIGDELERAIAGLDQSIARVQNAAGAAGMSQAFTPISYTQIAVAAAINNTADLFAAEAQTMDRDDPSWLRAMQRAVHLKRPSQKGQTVHDSEIIEHYLGLCSALRGANFNRPFVFVTANTRDYCDTAGALHGDLQHDFTAVNLDFVKDLSWARVRLGL